MPGARDSGWEPDAEIFEVRISLKDWKISQAGTSIDGFRLFPKAGLKTASRHGKTAASSQFWETSIKSVCGGSSGLQRKGILLSSHLQGCSPSTLYGKSSTEQSLDPMAFIYIPEGQWVSGIKADQNGPLFLVARFLLCAEEDGAHFLLFLVCHQCSRSCGGGVKVRGIHCIDTRGQRPLRPFHCQTASYKPPAQLPCHTKPCLSWYTSTWREVS